ncbi:MULTISPECIES: phosphonate ABC transporter substrate-binding protein [Comamonas]|uniref:Phosphonate ABC transporter substrate-binding protein n=1 Tax=Comamonas avium TaxID=2762231 RepID=A0ABR8S7E1_9BURK|nr:MULTISPECIES: phosphonate ABC transporter substrate-binding protein [Comamonas]MBD7958994.1 phosphonate ABC transporter substrate-binding protein [Comamonas avium]MBD9403234.1 phosphonate ABC transporter substrate-binding protein [Comamonas sp. CMM02]
MKMTRKAWLQTSIASLLLTATGAAWAQNSELRVGLIPSEDAQAMMRASQQVMEQLEQKTGLKVKPFVANDYNGVIEAMRSGKIDVAYFGPFSYVLAAQMANAEAFAIPVSKKSGQSSYQSIIISKKDKGPSSVAQLQGKTFAFVDPSSASGHLFPKAGLKGDGVDADKYFSRVIFSGSHDASIMAVAHGKVDAAAVASPIFQTAVAKGHVKAEDFQVIWTSQPIPESPMAWRKGLDAQTKQKVAAALAEIKGLPWGDRGVLNGFAATNDAAYNVVRDTAKTLNLDLGKMK